MTCAACPGLIPATFQVAGDEVARANGQRPKQPLDYRSYLHDTTKALAVLCLFAAAAVLFATDARADNCVSAAGGPWTTDATWSTCHEGSGSPYPQAGDAVTIADITGGHTVTLNMNASIASLTICDSVCDNDAILAHSGSYSLTVSGNVTIYGGAGNADNGIWDIADGSASATNVFFYPGSATSGRTADITISAGTLTTSGLSFYSASSYEDNQRLIITSNGRVNMAVNGTLGWGDVQPGTTSTVNLTGGALEYDSSQPTFANVIINGSVALNGSVTTANVTGDITVQSGTFSSDYANTITGNSGKTFQVNNGATFRMTGTSSAFPTGFSTITLQPTSTTQFFQATAVTIPAATYGNLELKPSASSVTFTLPNNILSIAGNLTTGVNGAYTGAVITGATNNQAIFTGNLNIGANSTFITGSGSTNLSGTGTPFTKTGTFTASTNNTFFYSGNGATTTAGTYYNLALYPNGSSAQVLGAGTYNVQALYIGDGTNAGATGDANDPTINASTLTIAANADFTTGSGTLTLTGMGTPFTKTGTFTASTGHTFVYDPSSSGAITTTAATYYNLALYPFSTSILDMGSGDHIVINNFTVSNSTWGSASALTNDPIITVGGDMLIGSDTVFTASDTSALTIGGSFSNGGGFNGGFSHSNGTFVFNTSSSGKSIIAGNDNFYKLTLNKSGQTISLGSDITVENILTFTTGTITTGSSKVIIPSGGSISRTSGHVVGNLQMYMPTGATSKTFVIGDSSNYTPVDVAFGNVSVAGNLTGSTAAGDHADIANSGINSSKSVNRTWTLAQDGTLAFNNYSATFNFVAGDIDGGADYNNFSVAKNTGGVWTKPTVGTRTSTSTQATGLTAFSDFQLGEEGAGGGGSPTDDGKVYLNDATLRDAYFK